MVLYCLLLLTTNAMAQERYVGLTRDSIESFHKTYFETETKNDTALVVKIKRGGSEWRYFSFDQQGICRKAAIEVPFFNDFTDLEKKLRTKKYKKAGEITYDFVVKKMHGALYTNGKDSYMLMFGAINPNMSASTRGIVYFKNQ